MEWTRYSALRDRKYPISNRPDDQIGATSCVRRCRDSSVVCKTLAKSVTASILKAEADILSKISHNNIVKVYELGFCDTEFWMVVTSCQVRFEDFVAKHCSKELLPSYFLALMHGLHHAHSFGICHGDISHNNVMFRQISSGNQFMFSPMWIDFGAAKVFEGVSRRAGKSERVRKGTPGYSCPEPREFGRKSDIYSFGVLILVGTRLTLGEDAFCQPLSEFEDFIPDDDENFVHTDDTKVLELFELVRKMSCENYLKRLDSSQVLQKMIEIVGPERSSPCREFKALASEEFHDQKKV